MSSARFLPEFPESPDQSFDVVLVTGDAYVDHPAFGVALIGRYLESLGYRVGILAQPDWKSAEEFRRFGRPRLFFGVTAGNLDSMVAHYTPDRRRRSKDAYSPGGAPGRRPDHASIVYAQRCKEAYPDIPVVLGGVEASLRRFAHYDYVQQKVRGSVLADAKADFLIYGMGERAVAALAAGLARGADVAELRSIRGLAYRTHGEAGGEGALVLPAAEEVAESKERFFEFSQALEAALLEPEPPVLVQPHGTLSIVVNPPAAPLSSQELDALYRLPFARAYPSRYEELGGIPALEPVRFSVVTHRGCYGGCSFCAISAHQGKKVVSRSPEGVVAEVRALVAHPEFRGTVQDVGGPTANMYCTAGAKPQACAACRRPSCLAPEICPNLDAPGAPLLELLRAVRRVPGVKHAFVASGLRHDLLLLPGQRRLLRELMQHHVGGHLKVAPEHIGSRALKLMGKPYARKFREFRVLFEKLRAEIEKELYLVPYLMTGHPGCDLRDGVDLALFAKEMGHFAEQVQDFTPTPMTRSTCMYWTGKDPSTGEGVPVPTGWQKELQRALVHYRDVRNRDFIIRSLERAGREDALIALYGPHYRRLVTPAAAKGRPAHRPAKRRPAAPKHRPERRA